MIPSGTPSSSADMTVHLPVPFWAATSRMSSTMYAPCESFAIRTFAVISVRYPLRSPRFQFAKISEMESLSRRLQFLRIEYVSAIICISAYSMPLCTILTKCPAPPSPIQRQHGSPSGARAAIALSAFLTFGHASGFPPGIMDGPFNAPSSPPDMPQPTKRIPFFANSATRRAVSRKSEFPPSIIMSPFAKCGSSRAAISSTASPALTISIAIRGLASDFANSAMSSVPKKFLPLPRPSRNFLTAESFLECGLLYTDTANPLSSRLSASEAPITPRPIKPMSDFFIILTVNSDF